MRNARVILLAVIALLMVGCNPVSYSEKTVYVSAKLVSQKAQALEPQSQQKPLCQTACLEIRDAPSSNPYLMYQDEIAGFSFQAGFAYKLRIQIRTTYAYYMLVPIPYDSWTLLETLEKTPASN